MSYQPREDPARHEPLRRLRWDADQVRAAIEQVVACTESQFHEDRYWPTHPLNREDGDAVARVETPLYHGACGVFWALHYLQAVGAVSLRRDYTAGLDRLLVRNRAWLGDTATREQGSFLMGDTPIRLLAFGVKPSDELGEALDVLIAGHGEHPSRELMWGSPGSLLAASFLHERTGQLRWAQRFRQTAARLWDSLEWSPRHACAYWTQELYGGRSAYLGAVRGFVGTALALIRGRHLLDTETWAGWERCIVNTVRASAERFGPQANWPAELDATGGPRKKLLQFCHGAPGVIVCLAGLPCTALDELLLAAGETVWAAGPLVKGSNLCHGTGGNGYALLKLYRRTGDPLWLERARAFAMHGIAQSRDHAARFGQWRYSLWTGDLGFAVYLWDCLRAEAQFPTLDVFHATGQRADSAI